MPIPGLSLVGFMDRRPALNYLRQACYLPGRTESALVQLWQASRAQLGDAMGVPGQPEILELPGTSAAHVAAVVAHPRFSETCAGMPHALKLVEINPLLAFQFHVLDNAAGLCVPGTLPDLQAMLDLCLPLGETVPTISSVIEIAGGFAIKSPDINALPRELVPGTDLNGRPVAGVSIGHRTSFVHAVRFDDRVYLKNGYHRARALSVAGATHMPAILIEATRYEQVGAVGGFTFDRGVLARLNAPTCGHLADGRAYPLPIRRVGRVIEMRLSLGLEALE